MQHARVRSPTGILPSSGFTRNVDSALLRASRQPYVLVLIEMKHIEQLVASGQDVVEWLAQRISAVR